MPTEKVIIVGNIQKVVTASMTRKMYSWSKWGGVNYGLVQKTKTADWTCQACGQKQTDQLPSYMFEFLPDEFIRICSHCQYVKNTREIDSLSALLDLVRQRLDMF